MKKKQCTIAKVLFIHSHQIKQKNKREKTKNIVVVKKGIKKGNLHAVCSSHEHVFIRDGEEKRRDISKSLGSGY